MCNDCGCALPRLAPAPNGSGFTPEIPLLHRLKQKNDDQARQNREQLQRSGVLAVNLMSSPGAGKTALLEALLPRLAPRLRCAVLVGDLATERDAERIRASGTPAIQITTGNACHLDARMIQSQLPALDLNTLDLLFIENVGNLVCPASFDLGQQLNLVLLSSTEGQDKPLKYPVMFRAADRVLISKADLLPLLGDFDPAQAEAYLRDLASQAPMMTLSARNGEGLPALADWLEQQCRAWRESRS